MTATRKETAGIAVMIAVSAMACQFALLRLAIPGAVSTAVMTGNLTNAVLSLMDLLARRCPPDAALRLKRNLLLICGFLVLSAAAVSLLGDWAWSLPVVAAGVGLACVSPTARKTSPPVYGGALR